MFHIHLVSKVTNFGHDRWVLIPSWCVEVFCSYYFQNGSRQYPSPDQSVASLVSQFMIHSTN